MGRGMRIASGKEYCLYLDHARNVERWFSEISDIWAEGISELPKNTKKKSKPAKKKRNSLAIVCKCGYMPPPGTDICPMCGNKCRRTKETAASVKAGEMRSARELKKEWSADLSLAMRDLGAVAYSRYDQKPEETDTYPARFARAQYKNVFGYWPKADIPPRYVCGEPDPAVVNYLKGVWKRSWKKR